MLNIITRELIPVSVHADIHAYRQSLGLEIFGYLTLEICGDEQNALTFRFHTQICIASPSMAMRCKAQRSILFAHGDVNGCEFTVYTTTQVNPVVFLKTRVYANRGEFYFQQLKNQLILLPIKQRKRSKNEAIRPEPIIVTCNVYVIR